MCIYISYKRVQLELPYTGDNATYRKTRCRVWDTFSLSYCLVVFWRYSVQPRLLTLLLFPTRICGWDPTAEDTTHFGHRTQRNQVGTDPGSFLTVDQLSCFWKILSELLEKKPSTDVILINYSMARQATQTGALRPTVWQDRPGRTRGMGILLWKSPYSCGVKTFWCGLRAVSRHSPVTSLLCSIRKPNKLIGSLG